MRITINLHTFHQNHKCSLLHPKCETCVAVWVLDNKCDAPQGRTEKLKGGETEGGGANIKKNILFL